MCDPLIFFTFLPTLCVGGKKAGQIREVVYTGVGGMEYIEISIPCLLFNSCFQCKIQNM